MNGPMFLHIPTDWPDTPENRAGLRAIVEWYERRPADERAAIAEADRRHEQVVDKLVMD